MENSSMINTAHKLLALISFTIFTNTLLANDQTHFTVAIIKNAQGSKELMAGQHRSGLQKLQQQSLIKVSFEQAMGVCVAQLKQDEFTSAEASCSAAIALSQRELGNSQHAKLLKAYAYNNRAIVRHYLQDTLGALQDFTSAYLLNNNQTIYNNLSRFKGFIAKDLPYENISMAVTPTGEL